MIETLPFISVTANVDNIKYLKACANNDLLKY